MSSRPGNQETENPRFIKSLQNERIKAIRALQMRKTRRESGLFVAEGVSILETARQSHWKPETLIYLKGPDRDNTTQNIIDSALHKGTECLEVNAAVLGKLASKDNPQSILGVFQQRYAPVIQPDQIAKKSVILALDEIRDPGNLGSIIRTVDAVGAVGIILIGNCCDPYSHEAVRASMGSIFSVKLMRTNQDEFRAWCTSWPGDIAGLHLQGTEDFRRATYSEPVLILMGSEGRGLNSSLTHQCTKLVQIPMNGNLDSLNLSVATALTLYQVCGPQLRLKSKCA